MPDRERGSLASRHQPSFPMDAYKLRHLVSSKKRARGTEILNFLLTSSLFGATSEVVGFDFFLVAGS